MEHNNANKYYDDIISDVKKTNTETKPTENEPIYSIDKNGDVKKTSSKGDDLLSMAIAAINKANIQTNDVKRSNTSKPPRDIIRVLKYNSA